MAKQVWPAVTPLHVTFLTFTGPPVLQHICATASPSIDWKHCLGGERKTLWDSCRAKEQVRHRPCSEAFHGLVYGDSDWLLDLGLLALINTFYWVEMLLVRVVTPCISEDKDF